jgi:hypothetical protein
MEKKAFPFLFGLREIASFKFKICRFHGDLHPFIQYPSEPQHGAFTRRRHHCCYFPAMLNQMPELRKIFKIPVDLRFVGKYRLKIFPMGVNDYFFLMIQIRELNGVTEQSKIPWRRTRVIMYVLLNPGPDSWLCIWV